MNQTRLLLSLFLVFLVHARCAAKQHDRPSWAEFRGSGGTGIAMGHRFPTDKLNESVQWEVGIHGKGWSSPVVYEDQVWLTTATEDGKEMSVVCVDLRSGKILFDQIVHKNESPDFCHPTNSYASPTPVVESGRVYAHFGTYGTTCIDTRSFQTIWQRTDLRCDHFRGPGSSPILFENVMIVALDGADQQYVIALDKQTGKTVWKKDRSINYQTENGDLKKSYGTGSVFLINEKPVLIYPSAVATVAYDARDGKELWTVYHQGMNASARPLMTAEGNVLIANGMGRMVAVDPKGAGNMTTAKIKWTLTKGVSRKPSPLVIKDRCYMISDKGVASCYRTLDGRVVWQERIGGAFSSSPVFDGHSIFVCSEQGKVTAFAAEDTYRELGKSKFPQGFKATPALFGNQMILRSFDKLYCITTK